MKKLPDERDEKKYRELERSAERLGLIEIINQGKSTIGGYKEYFISHKGSYLIDSNNLSINLKEKKYPLEILFDSECWNGFHNELI